MLLLATSLTVKLAQNIMICYQILSHSLIMLRYYNELFIKVD